MKIGIVSNSKLCLPLLSYLTNYNRAGVMLYLGKSTQPGLDVYDITAFCNAKGIPVHIENNPDELYNWQQLQEPEILFFSGYGHKVNVNNLKGATKGLYNIHFGKLPAFRGPSPVFWQLKRGEAQIGLSIHELTDKLDSGAVVWAHGIKNEEHHSYNYVNHIFGELQVRGVLDILEHINHGRPLTNITQNDDKAVYYGKPQLADVMINWEQMYAAEIINLVKACNSWNNGASTLINGYELKILDTRIVLEKQALDAPGTITIANKSFVVACKGGASLSIEFFNINNTCIPARHAGFYGLKTGQKFSNQYSGVSQKK